MRKVMAFIDGALFLDGTRGQGMSMNLDLPKLVRALTPDDQVVEIVYVGSLFDAGVYPTRLRNDQAMLARYAAQGVVTHGCPIEIKAHVFIDRGIEAGLATHMVMGAAQGRYDTALVISNRKELAEPVAAVQSLGKHVEVVFYEYESAPENPLKAMADSYRALAPATVLQFRIAGPKPTFSY